MVEKLSSTGFEDVLLFKVHDTGIGIAASHLIDIFESFSQPQSITTRKQGGSGLGLAIVKKLVNLHDSDIEVKSTEGIGSTFYFELKFNRADKSSEVIAKYSDNLQGRIVLLAEDNVINAMVISKLLSNWKITVEPAKNGLEALEKSRQKAFDFILMDIHMPEMDGFEAAKLIVSETDNPNRKTPIYALTADVTAEYRDEHHSYFNGFLRKPIELSKLYDALMSIIPA
ncbi:ATP-binding response regulator [Mucilaginibacter humi]|uniref:ATP-binding response regulator n=1 Tax=Mucilaginibacter humi TaxID=2732510 RepID=UPI00293BA2EA|nr:response regulator [Mucilaginibacter humi]